ncbi:MAG: metalloregulator ArsR/SmtB family transcription factor [Nakamurella sp.]
MKTSVLPVNAAEAPAAPAAVAARAPDVEGTEVAGTGHAADRTEGRTRAAVVDLLLADGPLTAADLAQQLGISPAAVRRHLDQLTAEGAVSSREVPAIGQRGRGRPARSYLLTEVGRSRLPHRYDELAVQALDFLAEAIGPQAVEDFARRRAEAVIEPYRAELDAAADVADRAGILAKALTGSGFSASLHQVGVGQQLCQHHCPVGQVASKYPQLCEEEMAVFTRELGTYAQRLATIARGDSVCTTFIPINTVTRIRATEPV